MTENPDDFTGLRVEISDRGQVTRLSIPISAISGMTREEFNDFTAGLQARVDEWFQGRGRHPNG